MVQTLLNRECQFLIKLNICFPYNPAIPLLSFYPRETSIRKHFYTKICTQMLKAILLIITKKWKQSKYTSWVNG